MSALLRAASQTIRQPDVQVPAARVGVRVAVVHRGRIQRRRLRRNATAVDRTATGAVAVTRTVATDDSVTITAAAAAIVTTTVITTTVVHHRRLDAGPRQAAQTPVTGHRTGVPRVHWRVFGHGTSARPARTRLDAPA